MNSYGHSRARNVRIRDNSELDGGGLLEEVFEGAMPLATLLGELTRMTSVLLLAGQQFNILAVIRILREPGNT